MPFRFLRILTAGQSWWFRCRWQFRRSQAAFLLQAVYRGSFFPLHCYGWICNRKLPKNPPPSVIQAQSSRALRDRPDRQAEGPGKAEIRKRIFCPLRRRRGSLLIPGSGISRRRLCRRRLRRRTDPRFSGHPEGSGLPLPPRCRRSVHGGGSDHAQLPLLYLPEYLQQI